MNLCCFLLILKSDYHYKTLLYKNYIDVVHLELDPPDVSLQEVDEGKLCEGAEDEGEADDDVDIHGGGVGHAGLVLPDKPHRHHSWGGQLSYLGALHCLHVSFVKCNENQRICGDPVKIVSSEQTAGLPRQQVMPRPTLATISPPAAKQWSVEQSL